MGYYRVRYPTEFKIVITADYSCTEVYSDLYGEEAIEDISEEEYMMYMMVPGTVVLERVHEVLCWHTT